MTIKTLKKEVNEWKHKAMNWRESKSYKELYEEVREKTQNKSRGISR